MFQTSMIYLFQVAAKYKVFTNILLTARGGTYTGGINIKAKNSLFWVSGLLTFTLIATGCGGSKTGVDPDIKVETVDLHAMIYTTSKNTVLTFDGRYNDSRTDTLETWWRMNVQVKGANGEVLKTGDNNGEVLGKEDVEFDINERPKLSHEIFRQKIWR